MCHQPLRGHALEHERVGVPRQVREAEQRADGVDPGRAQCRFRPRELVVDLLGGQIGEATVRVPVQTDEHPLGSQRGELVRVRRGPRPNRLG